MSTIELKNELHNLIDSITDETVLQRFFNLIKAENRNNNALWEDFTEEQQREIMLSNEEIKDRSTLTSHEEMKKFYSKWL
jgi:hypothetical protein